MKKRLIYISSPCRGNMKYNLKKAAEYCRSVALSFDTIPIAPHLYFTQFMDDNNPLERKMGMEMGVDILNICDELWVFGEPTEGMKAEIKVAESIGMPIQYKPENFDGIPF